MDFCFKAFESFREHETSEGKVSSAIVIETMVVIGYAEEKARRLVEAFCGAEKEVEYMKFLQWVLSAPTVAGSSETCAEKSSMLTELSDDERTLVTNYRRLQSPLFKGEALKAMNRLTTRERGARAYETELPDKHRQTVEDIIRNCSTSKKGLVLDQQEFEMLHRAVQSVHTIMATLGAVGMKILTNPRDDFHSCDLDHGNTLSNAEVMIWLKSCSRGAAVLRKDGGPPRAPSKSISYSDPDFGLFLNRVSLRCQAINEVDKYDKASELVRTMAQYGAAFQRLKSDPGYVAILSEAPSVPMLQPSEVQTIDDLLEHGSRNMFFIETIGEALCIEVRAPFWSMGPLKSRNRSVEKINNDYDGKVRRLLDVVRLSLVCENLSMMRSVIEYMKSHKDVEIIRIKSGFDPKMRHAAVCGGYRDVKLNCKHLPSGHLFEVQLHLLIFYSIKHEGGHALYEWSRRFSISGIVSADDVLHGLNPDLLEEMLQVAQGKLKVAIAARGDNSLHAMRCRLTNVSIAQLTCDADIWEPCVNMLLKQVENNNIPATSERDIAEIYLMAGSYLGSCFPAERALQLLAGARQLIEKIPEEERETTDILFLARCLVEVASWTFGTEDSLRSFRQAYEATRNILGEKHPMPILQLKNIGACLGRMGRLEEALPVLRECERLCLDVLGEDDIKTGNVCLELGQCNQGVSNWAESLAYYKRCEAIRVKIHGEIHPRVGNVLKCMGRCYLAQGDEEAARRELQRAIDIYDRFLAEYNGKSTSRVATEAVKDRGKCAAALP